MHAVPSFESSAFVMKDSHSETDAVGASLGMLAAGVAGLVLRVAAAGESVFASFPWGGTSGPATPSPCSRAPLYLRHSSGSA
jgi:hypothetical protein